MPTITADVTFREIAKQLKNEPKFKQCLADWNDSEFFWIKVLSSRTKGAVGEELISRWLKKAGFSVEKSTKRGIAKWLKMKGQAFDNCKSSDADLIVNDVPIEVKLSTMWEGGSFVFQQLRDQNYAYALFLGLAPNDIHCWFLSKETIIERWRKNTTKKRETIGDIVNQHASGSDTAWLHFSKDEPPAWLNQHGGTLEKALAIIRETIPKNESGVGIRTPSNRRGATP